MILVDAGIAPPLTNAVPQVPLTESYVEKLCGYL
jgi:hypothetical protein